MSWMVLRCGRWFTDYVETATSNGEPFKSAEGLALDEPVDSAQVAPSADPPGKDRRRIFQTVVPNWRVSEPVL